MLAETHAGYNGKGAVTLRQGVVSFSTSWFGALTAWGRQALVYICCSRSNLKIQLK